MGFPQVFHGCDFMVYMKTHLYMGFPWVHYFATAFHGYFITHEKRPNAFCGLTDLQTELEAAFTKLRT